MNPIAFGLLTALAVILPVYGHREFVARWLMDQVYKLEKKAEEAKKETS